MMIDHSRKGFCNKCKKIRKIYLGIEEDVKTYKCCFCDSPKIRIIIHKWKPYGDHKKKKYDYETIKVITNSSKCYTTKKIRKYSKEDPKVKRKFRKQRKHKR